MDSEFLQELLKLENINQVKRAMMQRRDEILQGIESGTIEPSKEVVDGLGELNIAIGDFDADAEEAEHGNQ